MVLPCTRGAAYELGHTSLSYSDPARGDRPVPTQAYYPAIAAGENVPVAAPPPGGFPAVAFGHGFLIPWSDYDFVWEGLVPEGFIVLLPDTESGLLPSHLDLGLDLAFVLRELRSESEDPGSLFYGAVSQSGAVCGHSMGGGASFLAAESDPSVTAIANLAAAETNPSAISAAASITAPALLFSGSNDCVTPPESHQVPMYDALASDCRTRVTLVGGSHCQFAEYNFACSLGEGGCPSPTITGEEQHDLTISLLAPWLHYALEDDVLAWAEFEGLLGMLPGVAHEMDCASTSVAEWDGPHADESLPLVSLAPATPNPFGSSTSFRYFLEEPLDVEVNVYSVSGRLVRRLHEGRRCAGWHLEEWDGLGHNGAAAASGVYVIALNAGGARVIRPMVLIR
jgi:pimeloyl-ACP methyl ester carboxylesterase